MDNQELQYQYNNHSIETDPDYSSFYHDEAAGTYRGLRLTDSNAAMRATFRGHDPCDFENYEHELLDYRRAQREFRSSPLGAAQWATSGGTSSSTSDNHSGADSDEEQG